MEEQLEATLKNIVEQKSLKWIFVGGKGGVGKTTTSSSLATLLAESGRKVLIISTDPAHNLSDCFDQKFTGKEPTPVNGIPNLAAMEIDPKIDPSKISLPGFMGEQDEGTKTFLSEIIGSVPGIDEAMSFSELIKSLDKYDYETIVFDTAPTGHTLRLLNFPNLLEKGLEKLLTLKTKFGGLIGSMQGMFGSEQQLNNSFDSLFENFEVMKKNAEKVAIQMKDVEKTTFIAVCIPEFLSLYETERLVQELATYNIDIHNIVINQVLFPEDNCKMCKSRSKMQKKYYDQMIDLYEDFHIVVVPLQEEEVRGPEKLKKFCQLLLTARQVPALN
ncbi:P-loop containing nucleoside triphosphate hydrolase [Pseudocohnilembus persalinus]|uniref:ATPase ASNA1 homolog n=1 Tax=Pseudocohnilembus persalinus TaxID=266149 RepID=A0A0V0QDD8_PSEPJ|nr:P-loop containing nucleoside triphosphate hydrolase [Pseudocohnilembus persalinus]|eukprot:KRX00101.1 P-loop containing nucleoside triphosphate hydrolase [Pseudocohnilembus persalinus]